MQVWGPQVSDIFARVRYEPKHELDAQIEATGHRVEDVKKIIIGHLHLDHAGGLDLFLDRKVRIARLLSFEYVCIRYRY